VAFLLRGGDVHEIYQLKRQGLSISAISAMTGFDRKTIRKYLADAEAAPRYTPRPPQPSKLAPYQAYIDQRLTAGVWNAQVLLRELRDRGYTGGVTILKEYLQPKRQAAREVAVRRFETPPGHQAQVDWGELGSLESAGERRATIYGFVFTLGSSRALFADLALDQTLATLLTLHEAAFEALGGVPQEILYDWMKTVVLGTDERGEVRWHPVFLDFARYWGFTPRLCRPYRPQTKGKVENGIRYLRGNFVLGCQAGAFPEMRTELRQWLWGVANRRVHGTTGRVIFDAWQDERAWLQGIGSRAPFPYVPQVARRVARDAYVSYQSNRYSVPWARVGQEVWLREVGGQVEIWASGERLAVHPHCRGHHQMLTVPAHHVGMPTTAPTRPGKAHVTLAAEPPAPTVEVRSLDVYETWAETGGPP
jgi:transposase